MIPCGLSPSLFFLWKERTKETKFVTKIGANENCSARLLLRWTQQKPALQRRFFRLLTTYIERAKPPPADPDGGRFRECNQKGATNLFYHTTRLVSFVGFTNFYGL